MFSATTKTPQSVKYNSQTSLGLKWPVKFLQQKEGGGAPQPRFAAQPALRPGALSQASSTAQPVAGAVRRAHRQHGKPAYVTGAHQNSSSCMTPLQKKTASTAARRRVRLKGAAAMPGRCTSRPAGWKDRAGGVLEGKTAGSSTLCSRYLQLDEEQPAKGVHIPQLELLPSMITSYTAARSTAETVMFHLRFQKSPTAGRKRAEEVNVTPSAIAGPDSGVRWEGRLRMQLSAASQGATQVLRHCTARNILYMISMAAAHSREVDA